MGKKSLLPRQREVLEGHLSTIAFSQDPNQRRKACDSFERAVRLFDGWGYNPREQLIQYEQYLTGTPITTPAEAVQPALPARCLMTGAGDYRD